MTTTYVALLRAVNLAGHNPVAMRDLRELFAALGMGNPRTLLQSGNVVFQSAAGADTLEAMFEAAAARDLGVATHFFVRSAAQWNAIVAANPFPTEAKRDPGHLVAVCLKTAPPRTAVAALQQAIRGRETVRAKGREAYVRYPDGMGRSKLTTALIEKHLGARGTARNWNTVLKLQALASADGAS